MRRWGWAAVVLVVVLAGASPAAAADSDGDGVGNARDRCPTIKAVGRPDGCPVGRWLARNANSAGTASHAVRFRSVAEVALGGDIDGDGIDSIITYDPNAGRWHFAEPLADAEAAARTSEGDRYRYVTEQLSMNFRAGPAPRVPITGDWDGDGTDGVGFYAPGAGRFFLRNDLTSGPADVVFAFGGEQPAAHVFPVAGDWNGDGIDTVGIFRRDTNRWRIRDANAAGPATYDVIRGRAGNAETPLTGDADGDGDDSPGITYLVLTEGGGSGLATGRRQYEPWLSMEPAGAGLNWSFGQARPTGTGTAGFLGDWDGNGTDTPGLRHR